MEGDCLSDLTWFEPVIKRYLIILAILSFWCPFDWPTHDLWIAFVFSTCYVTIKRIVTSASFARRSGTRWYCVGRRSHAFSFPKMRPCETARVSEEERCLAPSPRPSSAPEKQCLVRLQENYQALNSLATDRFLSTTSMNHCTPTNLHLAAFEYNLIYPPPPMYLSLITDSRRPW